jgi:hypothetical protein
MQKLSLECFFRTFFVSGSKFPGTLRKNVALVQKSSKTSVEQSFFVGCPRDVEICHIATTHTHICAHSPTSGDSSGQTAFICVLTHFED